jgi:hypothetical protein
MENIDGKIGKRIGDTILANSNYGELSYHNAYDIVDDAVDVGYLKVIIRDLIAWRIRWDVQHKIEII